MEETNKCCSLCKVDFKDESIFVLVNAKTNTYLCSDCVQEANKLVLKEVNQEINKDVKEPSNIKDKVFPKEIFNKISDSVISQDDAKRKIAIAVAQHQRRLIDPSIKKSNILLIGPTGTGKTEIARSVAELLNVPFVIADATSFTSRGYVGGDVESVIDRLIQAANYSIERAQKGIVFIDEIDKIARSQNPDSTATTTTVQQELLKIIEGTKVVIKKKTALGLTEEYTVDTGEILFICSGAFPGIINRKSDNQISLGIQQNPIILNKTEIETEDLIQYGLIEEFVGRFSVIAQTKSLEKSDLLKILTEPKNSLVRQYKKLFSLDNIELKFSEEFLNSVVELAFKEKTGARGLKKIIDKKIESLYYNLEDHKNKTITLSSENEDIKNNSNKENIQKLVS